MEVGIIDCLHVCQYYICPHLLLTIINQTQAKVNDRMYIETKRKEIRKRKRKKKLSSASSNPVLDTVNWNQRKVGLPSFPFVSSGESNYNITIILMNDFGSEGNTRFGHIDLYST